MNAPLVIDAAAPAAHAADDPRVCLLLNPRSFRSASNRLADAARALAARHGATLVEAHTPACFAQAVDDCLARRQWRIVVLAGDGTVQFIADHLAQRPQLCTLPQLLILGGGRTNLIAGDLGGRGALLRKLDAALAGRGFGDPAHEQRRATLRIEQSPAPPRHGFFVATGLVDNIIQAVRTHRDGGHGWLRKGIASTPWTLLKLALHALTGRSRLTEPVPMDLHAPGLGALRGPMRLLVAATLLHRHGLLDPYAQRGAGALRFTAVSAQARRFWWRLPQVLLGRFSRRMTPERGWLSGRCTQLDVTGLRAYTLDGETFATDPARPVRISAGPELRFLVP